MKKLRRVLVYRGYNFDGGIFARGGAAGEEEGGSKEYLYTSTEYHPEFDKPVLEQHFGMDGQVEQQTAYSYDGQGFLVRELILDAEGETIEEKSFEADAQQRISKSFRHYADGSFDTTAWSYDDNGKLIRKVSYDDEDQYEKKEEFIYEEGRLVRELVYDADDELSLEVEHTYDEEGLPDTLTEVNHTEGYVRRQEFHYNDHGQREAILTYDGDDKLIERFMFTLDDQGRAIQTVEENRQKKNTIHTAYDERGNVVLHEEYDMHGNLVARMARTYGEDNRIEGSEVLTQVPQRGQLEYTVRFVYEFFD